MIEKDTRNSSRLSRVESRIRKRRGQTSGLWRWCRSLGAGRVARVKEAARRARSRGGEALHSAQGSIQRAFRKLPRRLQVVLPLVLVGLLALGATYLVVWSYSSERPWNQPELGEVGQGAEDPLGQEGTTDDNVGVIDDNDEDPVDPEDGIGVAGNGSAGSDMPGGTADIEDDGLELVETETEPGIDPGTDPGIDPGLQPGDDSVPALAQPAAAVADKGDLVWPTAGEITTQFALIYSETMGDYRMHAGVDIKAEEGQPVVAALPGTVTRAEEDHLWGWTVVLDHGGGLTTVYSGCASLSVAEGNRVEQGQEIATVGSSTLVETGTGPHLHFEIREQGLAIDPEPLLRGTQ